MGNANDSQDRIPSERPEAPVMLALSTFRRSEKAVAIAIEKAAGIGSLVIVHVADVNLARYLIGTDIGLYPGLKRKCEEELLREHQQHGEQHVEEIAERARARGLDVTCHVRTGRFAQVCLGIVAEQRPSLIITTRSHRPWWVRRFFGSPVDHLIAHAGCPVIEA